MAARVNSAEAVQAAPSLPMAGKSPLADNLPAWVAAGATPWVISTIRDGLVLKWKEGRPPPPHVGVTRQTECSPELAEVLKEQAQRGIWRRVVPGDPVKWVSRAFAIPKGNGEGYRLLVDHSELSKHLMAPHFKMGSIRDAIALMEPGAWLAKIDLANAYAQIPLSSDAAAYLVCQAGKDLWWPLGMPQGTSCAPFVFTAVIKTVWRALRAQNIQVLGYLDDCLLVMPRMSKEEAQEQLKAGVDMFTRLGFQVNLEKTSKEPGHAITFLGLEIDTARWTVSWPKAKRLAVQKEAARLLCQPITPRALAHVVGAAKAAAQAWPLVHLELFNLQRVIAEKARDGWDKPFHANAVTFHELRTLVKLLSKEKVAPLSRGRTHATLRTDAAPSHGWGAVLNIGTREWRYGEAWPASQHMKHSTELEMRAVLCAITHFQPLLQDVKLLIESDCSTVVHDLNRKRAGSRALQTLALQVLQLVDKLNIELTCSHLAGALNLISDKLSRTEIHSGLVLRAEVFAVIQEQLGPCTIDAFATHSNAKLPRYFTRLPDPNAEAQDFFSQHLSQQELYYIFPPIALLLRTLAKLRKEHARAVVVAPCFPEQVWAPLLRLGASRSIDLGPDPLVPNQACAELPTGTQWRAYRWEMLEPSHELHSVRAPGQSMTMHSANGQNSA